MGTLMSEKPSMTFRTLCRVGARWRNKTRCSPRLIKYCDKLLVRLRRCASTLLREPENGLESMVIDGYFLLL
jgi:hypothetical protein